MSGGSGPARGLALVGLRGTGKTTVGRLVAARLGRPFLDTDDLIVEQAGRSIAAIFAESGEALFRELEAEALAAATAEPGRVLATGGGIVLRASNRDLLRQYGYVVWLKADPAVLAARLEADPDQVTSRPALTPAGTVAELAEVLAARTPLYRELADAEIETAGLEPERVAAAVLEACPLLDER